MRVLIQRVRQASVSIDGNLRSAIGAGMLLFVGIEEADNEDDIAWLTGKIIKLRIFDDPQGMMNLDVQQVGGEMLVVSQFTLHASTKKGNRPSYIKAAPESVSRPLYERFTTTLSEALGQHVATGEFGANMQVTLTNDGPVTIWIDSRNKE